MKIHHYLQGIIELVDTIRAHRSVDDVISNFRKTSDTVFEKHYPNSFRDTDLDKCLQNKEIGKLVICGAMTHMCIDTTVRAGFDLGYNIKLVANACATKDLVYNGEVIKADLVHKSFLSALSGTFCEVI